MKSLVTHARAVNRRHCISLGCLRNSDNHVKHFYLNLSSIAGCLYNLSKVL